jgi:hypothetical protein
MRNVTVFIEITLVGEFNYFILLRDTILFPEEAVSTERANAATQIA